MSSKKEPPRKGWRRYVPEAEHYVHLTYFALVALHGPYWVAAGGCFLLGVTLVILDKGG